MSTFMCSFSVDNSANIHAAVDLFYRFWLVDRKFLHQPYELLTGEISDLLLVAGPAEPSAFKSFVEQQKTVTLPKQCFQTAFSSSADRVIVSFFYSLVEGRGVVGGYFYSCCIDDNA